MLEALVGEYKRRENDAQKGRSIGTLIQRMALHAAPRFSTDSNTLERRQDSQNSSQSSHTLLPSVIVPGFAQSGQDTQNSVQIPSLTSTNNFINFCLTVPDLPITDGQQISTGSCNPAPMGHLPSTEHMPSTKITQPRNGDIFGENTPFTVTISTQNLQTGISVNARSNYISAPQQLGTDGNIMGHYHLVIEELSSFDQKTVTDPTRFVFFKDISALSTDVTGGMPAGLYRLTVTTHTANHQPALVPVAQHGSLGDAVYFTVTSSVKRRNHKVTPSQPHVPSRRSAFTTEQNLTPRATPSRLRKIRRKPLNVQAIRRASTDDQTSTTLNPSVIAAGFANDGQGTDSTLGLTASLTSTNNFINYCATLTDVPLTNGAQVTSGSCNSAPMGAIPTEKNIPSVRFTFPTFNSTLPVNTSFNISLATANLETGQFTNPVSNYLAAPQQLTSDGKIRGYVSIVIESVSSMGQTIPTNPQIFAFYQSIPQASDANGLLSSSVKEGLPAGIYRLSSTVRAANHQPALAPVSIHGSIDDVVYFSVASNGSLPANQTVPASVSSTHGSSTSTRSAVPSNSQNPLPDQSQHRNSKIGIAVGASLAVLFVIAIVSLLVWRFRKARTKALKSRFVIDEQPAFSLTPFTTRNPAVPAYRSFVNNRKDGPSSNEASDSTSRLTDAPPNPSQEAGPSKRNEGRGQQSRNRISDVSLAPSYHTTIQRPS